MRATFQFVTTHGWESALIRLATWSEFSHVDIVLPNGKLLGAHYAGGVAIREPNYEKFTGIARYHVNLTDRQAAIFYRFLYNQLGKPYDWQAILGIAIHRDWQETDSWFCSELAAAALIKAKVKVISQVLNRVTPELLTLSPVLQRDKKFALQVV